MTATVVDCRTTGLYYDGTGMSVHAAKVWDDFWGSYEGVFWHVAHSFASTYVVSVYGGGMIHPEGFRIAIMQPLDRVNLEVRELKDAFTTLAEKLGFTVDLKVAEVRDAELDFRDIPDQRTMKEKHAK